MEGHGCRWRALEEHHALAQRQVKVLRDELKAAQGRQGGRQSQRQRNDPALRGTGAGDLGGLLGGALYESSGGEGAFLLSAVATALGGLLLALSAARR